MELAVNTFTKGLQNDTHPIVQSNDTLSDALNATFITMNGNEVMLLNDMGNRRIDNAYLPPGYEPVGMKEYGGIIYVAAYNPVTNKSLIGSFPSPERKISSLDGSELGGTLNFNLFINNFYYDSTLNNLKCLKTDTILVPLTKDTSLHAGDKFVVYGTLDNPDEDITNYYNTQNNKIVSPKNKKYTLALGILNSQNEFVDITKTLARWKLNKNKAEIVDYTNSNVSDFFKFNDGYFIALNFEIPHISETISDKELILERQTIATNTYAYKLVGPLYIKATLNHILDFSYNIYGNRISYNLGEIWIEAFITYNCPDGRITGEGTDDDYITYAEGTLNENNFPIFDLIDVTGTSTKMTFSSTEKTKYDLNTNLYTYKITKKYNITGENNIYEYVIGVQSGLDSLYLSGLSSKGSIDISKLGSGEVSLRSWRFINDYNNGNGSSTISYTFEAYPKYGESFKNFKLVLMNVKESDCVKDYNENKYRTVTKHEIPATLYNGKNTLNIDWSIYELSRNNLYKVVWEYDKIKEEDGSVISHTISFRDNSNYLLKDRWLLTTDLFNSCFISNSSSYINDYGNLVTDLERAIFESKCKISYTITPNISDRVSTPNIISTGELIRKNSNDIKLLYTTTKNISLNFSPTISFNENLYPDNISIKPTAVNNINISDIVGKCEGSMVYINRDSATPKKYSDDTNPTNYEPTFRLTSSTGKVKTISGVLTNYDLYESVGISSGSINNGFVSFRDFLSKIMENNPQSADKRFGMVSVDWHDSGKDDGHYLNIIVNSTKESMEVIGSDGGTTPNQIRLASQEADDKVVFTLTDYNSAILEKLLNINSQLIFFWGYASDGGDNISSSQERDKGVKLNLYARVWWRTSNGDWALFKNTKYKTTSIVDFVYNNFSIKDFKFAYYSSTTFDAENLYRPNQERSRQSSEYTFNFNISWKMTLNKNDVFDIVNLNKFSCNYPKFETESLNSDDYFYPLEVSSSQSFLSVINETIPNLGDIDGIDIETGKTRDTYGDPLNGNGTYIINGSGELEYKDIPRILITDRWGSPNKRTIVYDGDTSGSPNELYDVCGSDGDSHTVLAYDKVNIVRL